MSQYLGFNVLSQVKKRWSASDRRGGRKMSSNMGKVMAQQKVQRTSLYGASLPVNKKKMLQEEAMRMIGKPKSIMAKPYATARGRLKE